MNKTQFVAGVFVVAVGAAIFTIRFVLEHSAWGLRGLAYAAYGIYMIRDAVKNP